MEDLTQKFRGLTTSDDRLSMLEQIVHSLNHGELQALSQLISERHDPLCRLPVELILEIFSYLPLFDTWRLQVVCRQWRTVLSTEQLQRAAISRYDTHHHSDSAGRPDMSVASKVRHAKAMRLGKPFTTALYDDVRGLPKTDYYGQSSSTAFKGETLAYVRTLDGHADEIVVRNLISGSWSTIVNDGREQIMAITLTTSLLAWVTYMGWLYVLDRANGTRTSFRLPSASFQALASDGDSVALLMMGKPNTLAFYSARNGKLRTRQFPHQSVQEGERARLVLHPKQLLCDAESQRADVFTFLSADMCRIGHLRFDFSGVSNDQFAKPISDTILVRQVQQDTHVQVFVDLQPTGELGQYRLRLRELHTARPVRYIVGWAAWGGHSSLLFDARTGSLSWEDYDLLPLSTLAPLTVEQHAHIANKLVKWKDVFVSPDSVTAFDTVVSLPSMRHTTRQYRNVRAYNVTPPTGLAAWSAGPAYYMNDSFVVGVERLERNPQADDQPGRICVHCFDENIHLAGGLSTGLWDDHRAEGESAS